MHGLLETARAVAHLAEDSGASQLRPLHVPARNAAHTMGQEARHAGGAAGMRAAASPTIQLCLQAVVLCSCWLIAACALTADHTSNA